MYLLDCQLVTARPCSTSSQLLLRGFSVSLTHHSFPIRLTCCSPLRMAPHSSSHSTSQSSPHDVASAQSLALALAGRAPTGQSALTGGKQQQQQAAAAEGRRSNPERHSLSSSGSHEWDGEREWECEPEELVVVEAAAALLSFADLISP